MFSDFLQQVCINVRFLLCVNPIFQTDAVQIKTIMDCEVCLV